MFARRVALGSVILGFAQIVVRVLDIALLAIVARFLTPDDFGLVALAASVRIVTGALTELPAGTALVQRKNLIQDDIDTAFTLNLLRGALVGLIMLASSPLMAIVYDEPDLIAILVFLALAPIIQGASSPMMINFARELNYGPIATVQVVTKSATFVTTVIIAVTLESYWALIAGMVATPAAQAMATYFVAPYRPRLTLVSARGIIAFSGWISLSRIIFTINQHSDRFFIGGILGRASLGQYAVGSDIASIATYSLATPMVNTLFSGFSRINDNMDRLRSAYLQGQQVMVMVLLPLGVGLSILAEPIVTLMMGKQWGPAVEVIRWLAPVLALQSMAIGVQPLSMALDRTRVLAMRELIALLLRLPATILSAWIFGLIGAVIARALTGLVLTWMNVNIAYRLVQVSSFDQFVNCSRSLTSVVTMAIVLLSISFLFPSLNDRPALTLACFIPSGVIAYVASHLVLWHMAGTPDGAEQFVLKTLATGFRRIRKRAKE